MDYCNGKATVIVVNDNYKLAPWADILYACDSTWWGWHDGVPDFKGRKITQNCSGGDETAEKYGLECIESRDEPGLSVDKSYITQGQNSGYQAINLAFHEGAEKIILLGYDMKATGGKSHWFGDHPNAQPSSHSSFLDNYQSIPLQLADLELEIINCTRSTALTCFPQKELKDCL